MYFHYACYIHECERFFSLYRYDNPASMENAPARQLTYNYLLPINAWLLLFPSGLCCDWTMGTIPVISSVLDPRNLITVGFYAVLGKFIHFMLQQQDKRNRVIIMVIIWHLYLFIMSYWFCVKLIMIRLISLIPASPFIPWYINHYINLSNG